MVLSSPCQSAMSMPMQFTSWLCSWHVSTPAAETQLLKSFNPSSIKPSLSEPKAPSTQFLWAKGSFNPTSLSQRLLQPNFSGPKGLSSKLLWPKGLDLWKHDLRECWRMHLLKQLQHERSHQYARATQIDRVRTMKFHDQLQVLADSCDVPDLSLTQEEAWMKIAVLRRLLAGGLLTEARIRRHKRRQDVQLCSCNLGEEATVEHVSWRCLHFHDIRQPMMNALTDQISHFPIITQYAGIFLNESPLSQNQITLVQSTLVEIWQANIQRFYADDLNNNPPDEPDQSSNRRQPRDANGHSLVFKEGGGVFCQKCGKYVQIWVTSSWKLPSRLVNFLMYNQQITSPNLVRPIIVTGSNEPFKNSIKSTTVATMTLNGITK